MMPEWHQLVCMSGHVKESEAAKILQLYATSIFQVHSFVCQLDYIYVVSCHGVSQGGDIISLLLLGEYRVSYLSVRSFKMFS